MGLDVSCDPVHPQRMVFIFLVAYATVLCAVAMQLSLGMPLWVPV